VMLARGGWKHWRGILAFAGLCVLLGTPWYLRHLNDIAGLTSGATGGSGGSAADYAGNVTPPRWSSHNFGWYFWDLVNLQLLVPLTVLFVTGATAAALRFLRHRRADDLTPELLVGGLCAWVAVTLLTLKDPRYSLPALVFVAALAAAPIGLWRHASGFAYLGAIGTVAIGNLIGISTGAGTPLRIYLPNAPRESGLGERVLTVYRPDGYIAGSPRKDGAVLAAMRAAYVDGVRTIEFDPGANALPFNSEGLAALARVARLRRPPAYDPAKLRPRDAFMLRHLPVAGDPPPCARVSDGSTMYMVLGNPYRPFKQYDFYCPTRRPERYRAAAN
jgi:hypothetical protein